MRDDSLPEKREKKEMTKSCYFIGKDCVVSKRFLSIVTIIGAIALLSSPVCAQESEPNAPHKSGHEMGMKMRHDKMPNHRSGMHSFKPITPETKGHIAEMYTKMGECVKTEMSIEDCQKKVMIDCPVVKELGYCPLMDGIAPMKGAANLHQERSK